MTWQLAMLPHSSIILSRYIVYRHAKDGCEQTVLRPLSNERSDKRKFNTYKTQRVVCVGLSGSKKDILSQKVLLYDKHVCICSNNIKQGTRQSLISWHARTNKMIKKELRIQSSHLCINTAATKRRIKLFVRFSA